MAPFIILGIIIVVCILLIVISIILFVKSIEGWIPFSISSVVHKYGTKFSGLGPDLIEFDDCKFNIKYKYDTTLVNVTRDVTNILNQMSRSTFSNVPFQKDKPQQNVYLDPLTPLSFLSEDSLGNVQDFPGIDDSKVINYFNTKNKNIKDYYNFGIYNFSGNNLSFCTVEQLEKLKDNIFGKYKDKDGKEHDNFNVAYICTLTGRLKKATVEIKNETDTSIIALHPIRFNSYGNKFEYKCPVICSSPTDKSCIECCKKCYTFDASGNITGMSKYFPNECGCAYKSTCTKGTETKDCYKLGCPYNVDKLGFGDAPFSWDENAEFTSSRGPNVLTGKETGEDKKNYDLMFHDNSVGEKRSWLGKNNKDIITTFNHDSFLNTFKKQIMWKQTDTEVLKCSNPYNYQNGESQCTALSNAVQN